MPSPFPGMDPYLESHWRDVHTRLIIYASDALQSVLPRSLRARVEERVLLEAPLGIVDHPLFPDVRVVEYHTRRGESGSGMGTAVAEPLIVESEYEIPTEPFIEIVDRESGNRLVTIIEFLSPSNKSPGPNREQYIRKQREVCVSHTNLVEVDLNRFGIHTLAFPLGEIPTPNRTRYMVCVRRAARRGKAEVYPLPLRERLPIVKIPLREKDRDVPLDLQLLVEQCYKNGGYEGTLNYAVEPDPPLQGADEKWTAEHLHEQGLRPQKKAIRRKGKPKAR